VGNYDPLKVELNKNCLNKIWLYAGTSEYI